MANMNLSKKAVRALADEMTNYKTKFESSMEESNEALVDLGTSFQDERYSDFKRSYKNIESTMKELVKNLEKATERLNYIYSILPK